ncbi:MAG TPA: ubiquinol-cytochrome c reductase iron-sulfur subunit [Patescibacteria group bacterium]|jgi:menaquinol-cytochrome c reductase iron-sulfur subunit|nr:ubiquinol-cytochrome c reductase iron-sulfur subunit [Patescibacteria group bacterium]
MKENTKTGECNRREFLAKLSIALSGIAGALVAIPVIGSIIAPLFQKRQEVWRSVGAVESFEIGATVQVSFIDASPLLWAGITAKSAAWLRRVGEEEFIAFSVNCSHLGCPVRWIAGAKLFMCPCHGGVYYEDGSVASGPPPRGLYQYPVRANNGQVEILASPIPITTT